MNTLTTEELNSLTDRYSTTSFVLELPSSIPVRRSLDFREKSSPSVERNLFLAERNEELQQELLSVKKLLAEIIDEMLQANSKIMQQERHIEALVKRLHSTEDTLRSITGESETFIVHDTQNPTNESDVDSFIQKVQEESPTTEKLLEIIRDLKLENAKLRR